jgi:AraC-like DNA-binding protein
VEPTPAQRRRFVELLQAFAPRQGRNATPWPGLRCYRSSRPTVPDPAVYAPSLCIVGQGAKQARIGDQVFRYDSLQYLMFGAHLPVHAAVTEASEERPFLSVVLEIGASDVHDVLVEMSDGDGRGTPSRWPGTPPLRVSPVDARFLDAVLRFLAAVADPMDRRILAPAALREIVYLALQGDQGDVLRVAVREGRRLPKVARALHYMHRHLHERVDVPTLARSAGMSASSLHHAFKSATTLSPIQYLKRMRLDQARRLMLEEGCPAADAAFRVGYESPSQFSREFKRLFGLPPRQYLERQAG